VNLLYVSHNTCSQECNSQSQDVRVTLGRS
jgi:hypothetical protein